MLKCDVCGEEVKRPQPVEYTLTLACLNPATEDYRSKKERTFDLHSHCLKFLMEGFDGYVEAMCISARFGLIKYQYLNKKAKDEER
jgi:hypothetical protein